MSVKCILQGQNNGSVNSYYGTCSTVAATAAKVVSLAGFTLVTGAKVAVKFTITNSAANPTLNINNTGAKPIYYRGSAITASYLAANRTYEFVYNGTQYELIGDIDTDSNTTYTPASATPLVAGTAAVGTSTKYAREDHVHPAQTTITGNAGTATKLATSRTIRTNLASTSTASFNGTANIDPGVTGVLPITNGGTGCSTEDEFNKKIEQIAKKIVDIDIIWGNENEVGNATWWANLKSWAASATATERQACLGKTKKVSLSTAVLGANQVTMMCVAYDHDGTGTLTFQSKYGLPTQFAFSSSSALWNGSTAQTHCNNFANYCSASASLKSVTQKTSSTCNGNKNNAADVQTTAKCWLPSECQMGLANNYSSSNIEWSVNGKEEAYQYYTSASSRIKNYQDANGNDGGSTCWYWERSRYYLASFSNRVCGVNDSGNSGGINYTGTSGRLAPAFTIG